LKYQRFLPSGCKDKRFRKFKFVAKPESLNSLISLFKRGMIKILAEPVDWNSGIHNLFIQSSINNGYLQGYNAGKVISEVNGYFLLQCTVSGR